MITKLFSIISGKVSLNRKIELFYDETRIRLQFSPDACTRLIVQ